MAPEREPGAPGARRECLGKNQIGTLGSGNHYLEVQAVAEVYDAAAAAAFGLAEGAVCVLIHCGSSGLGHQACQDFVNACRRRR